MNSLAKREQRTAAIAISGKAASMAWEWVEYSVAELEDLYGAFFKGDTLWRPVDSPCPNICQLSLKAPPPVVHQQPLMAEDAE